MLKNCQISHICLKKHKSSIATDDIITKYFHNALGHRVKKTSGASTSLFMYDEAGQLLGEYNSAGNALYETVYLDEQPIAVLKPAISTSGYKAYYLYADHLNTPRLITDNAAGAANKKVWQWDSDPFGITPPNENPTAAGVFTYNPRFPSQVYNKETGLHYNYFRDYNPGTGRYVQSDPIGLAGGMNTVGYVDGNPISHIDPEGLEGLLGLTTFESTKRQTLDQAVKQGALQEDLFFLLSVLD
jgi:RHS repeat-associated protein